MSSEFEYEPDDHLTTLIDIYSKGDKDALDDLVPLVYQRLKDMAVAMFSRESKNHTLQPTALINEVYLQLAKSHGMHFENRSQFFAFSAQIMRNVLTKYARERLALKRGGDKVVYSLNEDLDSAAERGMDPAGIIQVDRALKKFSKVFPRKCTVVQLRFFGGLTLDEVAEVMDISKATVKREWRSAKLWLSQEMELGDIEEGETDADEQT